MKIAMISPVRKDGGGVKTHVLELAKVLKEPVKIFGGDVKEDFEKRINKNITIVGYKYLVNLYNVKYLYEKRVKENFKRILKEEKFDIIHLHHPVFSFAEPKYYDGIPYIFTVHFPLEMEYSSWNDMYKQAAKLLIKRYG